MTRAEARQEVERQIDRMVLARTAYQRAYRLLFEARERARATSTADAARALSQVESHFQRAMTKLWRAERAYCVARDRHDYIQRAGAL